MNRITLIITILLFGSTAMAKTYVGRLILKSGGGKSISVEVVANNPAQAKTIIEAQYKGQIRSWATKPAEGKSTKTKAYMGQVILKTSGGKSVPVRVEAENPAQAKKIIEAQFSGQIRSWAKKPALVR